MPIDKAIELLNDLFHLETEDLTANHDNAIKLGIEALKRLQKARQIWVLPALLKLLPGETEK